MITALAIVGGLCIIGGVVLAIAKVSLWVVNVNGFEDEFRRLSNRADSAVDIAEALSKALRTIEGSMDLRLDIVSERLFKLSEQVSALESTNSK